MSCISKKDLDEDNGQISAGLICLNGSDQRPVSPCKELYDRIVYDGSESNHQSLHTTSLSQDNLAPSSPESPDNFTIFVNSLPASAVKAEQDARISEIVQGSAETKQAVILATEKKKTPKDKKPKDPKAHLSLLSLDNIHTVSILCWRRGRKAYLATSDAVEHDEEDEDDNWHITETVLFVLYRFVGYFVLVAQFTFLWSLLDLYASDFADSDNKRKPFPVKYTAGMTDRDFGTNPLNVTIAAWDAARSASNLKQCQTWVLECGARWAAGEGCEREADIKSNCPPWDYEKFLQGRNGSEPICYRSDGVAVHGGSPYYGSITKGVILEWVLGCETLQRAENDELSAKWLCARPDATGAGGIATRPAAARRRTRWARWPGRRRHPSRGRLGPLARGRRAGAAGRGGGGDRNGTPCS
jgi:hypothetical protein